MYTHRRLSAPFLIYLACCVVCSSFAACVLVLVVFFFKQKTAYEMRISDWSSDVCSSDLIVLVDAGHPYMQPLRDPIRSLIYSAGDRAVRSEERRVGKECVSTCRSRWSPSH